MEPNVRSVYPRSLVDSNENRIADLRAASITLLILPTLAVFLRLLSRWMSRAGFWWDDYTCILAMALSWGPNVASLDAANRGLGQHYQKIARPPHLLAPLHQFMQNTYAFVILYILATTVVKFSFIFFVYRIFPLRKLRRFLLACHLFAGLLGLSALLVAIFQCVPVQDFWRTLGGRRGGKCVKITKFWIATGSLNATVNFVLLALPIPLLWKLRTSRLQKLVLTMIFIFGLTVCAVGLAHVIVLSRLHINLDLTYTYVDSAIWTAAEPSIAVVCACLPSFRPLLARLIWGRSYRPTHLPHSSRRSLSKGWLSESNDRESQPSRGFNRLTESDANSYGPKGSWTHNVAVSSGPKKGGENDFPLEEGGRVSYYDLPAKGIRVKTTVTIERIDWKEELF